MKIGILTTFSGAEKEPLADYVRGVGRIVEERGFHAIWVPEHVVGFHAYDPRFPYPYADDGAAPASLATEGLVDPMSLLTAMAMCTHRIQLCTGIAILPQRNPVYFAKMGAAIDLLSAGRFVPGIGLGWSGQEYEALGVPWAERGKRMDEYIAVLRTLWQDNVAAFHGKHYDLPECVQLPRPVRKPFPPLHIGGESDAALRRVATMGQGWIGLRLLPEGLGKRLARLDAALAEAGRSRAEIEIVVSPAEVPCDRAMRDRYAEAGASQVVVMAGGGDLDSFERQADQLAAELID